MEDITSRYTREFLLLFAIITMATWVLMILACAIDLWTGIDKARAKGEKIDSHNLRRTMVKISEYWRVQIFGLMIDSVGSLFYSTPIASIVIGLACVGMEGISVIENLREKKSAAGKVPDLIAKIIAAKTHGDANELIELLRVQIKTEEDKQE